MARSKVPRHHPSSASHPAVLCHGHRANSLQGIRDRQSSLPNPIEKRGLGTSVLPQLQPCCCPRPCHPSPSPACPGFTLGLQRAARCVHSVSLSPLPHHVLLGTPRRNPRRAPTWQSCPVVTVTTGDINPSPR